MKAEHRIKAEHHSAAAEHRKELRTNVLADRMGRFMQTVRQRPRGRTLLIWIAVVAVIIALFVWWMIRNTHANQNSEWWSKLFKGYPPQLVIKDYPDTKQAQVSEAMYDFRRLTDWGMLDIKVNREVTDPQTNEKKPVQVTVPAGIYNIKVPVKGKVQEAADLQEANRYLYGYLQEQFKNFHEKVKDDQALGSEALYNQAVACETRAAFEKSPLQALKQAKELFTQVTKDYKDTARAFLAQKRLDEVYDTTDKMNALVEFYQLLSGE
jgi:hypothetical protein